MSITVEAVSSSEIKIIVQPGKIRERLDTFLAHQIENATRTKVQESVREGLVTVNGKRIKPSYKISPGDVIHCTIQRKKPPDVVAQNIPLSVVYEDDNLLVVNKPAGMVTHPAYGNYSDTLVNALLYRCNERLSAVNETTRPGIVHRLDKGTSGLLVIAKDDATHAHLARQFLQKTVEREYWAVVWGLFEKEKKSYLIEAALGRSKSDRKKFAVSDAGKAASTMYDVIGEFEYLSLVRLKLQTGRTHQIRVHLHYVGHPVFGDPTYGGRRIAWGGFGKRKKEEVQNLLKVIGRQALHAKTIGFFHPVKKKMMRFDSDLPSDMSLLLDLLRTG